MRISATDGFQETEIGGRIMRIRQKRMLLLLAMSLIPAILIALLLTRLLSGTGNELAQQSREILTERARFHLKTLVDDYGRIVSRDLKAVELALTRQASEVERRLAEEPVANPRLFFSADYDTQMAALGELVLTDEHCRIVAGKRTQIPVSFDEQVYVPVDNINPAAVRDDMARLATMPAAYRELRDSNPTLIRWLYTALEVGFHSSYPGHGGYPAGYDPRTRAWYTGPRESAGLSWTILPDVSTREVSFTASRPVHQSNGSFAGITAIDIRLDGVLQTVRLPEGWEGAATVLHIQPDLERDPPEEQLRIVVQESYIEYGEKWQDALEWQYLVTSDMESLLAMKADLAAGRSGVRRMEYGGQDSFWGYGVWHGNNLVPVVIVAYELVTAQAAEAERFVQHEILGSMRLAGAILVAVLMVAVLAAVQSSRAVTRPIRQLAGAARQLMQGVTCHIILNPSC